MGKNKNLRRINVLVTAQTAYNLKKLANMDGQRNEGRVIDKLVRDRMRQLHNTIREVDDEQI
jgi:hypothetical protein